MLLVKENSQPRMHRIMPTCFNGLIKVFAKYLSWAKGITENDIKYSPRKRKTSYIFEQENESKTSYIHERREC